MREPSMVETVGVFVEDRNPLETATSGVAWPAIIGGAFAAAALSLILIALGSGFGLASVSPWFNAGASATTFTVMTAVWLIVTQWLASGLGGYLTGRLRTKLVGLLHTHEVFFRDTANGLLTWATATVIGIAVLAATASAVASGSAAMVADPLATADAVAARTAIPITVAVAHVKRPLAVSRKNTSCVCSRPTHLVRSRPVR